MRETFLSLENDALKLFDGVETAFINNFTDAMLSKNGQLSIYTVLGDKVVVEGVCPETQNPPDKCKDLAVLGLREQIVIVSLQQVDSVTHIRCDDEKVAKSMRALYKNLLPKQDVLKITYRNGGLTVVFGDVSDIARFAKVLEKRKYSAKVEEDGSYTMNDVQSGQPVPVDKFSKAVICEAFEEGVDEVFLYRPLAFANK